MVAYEVDVSGSPVQVTYNGRIVAEAMGLEISGADVSLIEPGLLAVSGDVQVSERNNRVYIEHDGGAFGF